MTNFPTLSDLARELGIARSSAHALCSTLGVHLELLIRRGDQTFQLGPRHAMVERLCPAIRRGDGVGETELPGGNNYPFGARRERGLLSRRTQFER
ncbi:helix-turn-helix domain-containing protein [Mesorhizobium sp. BR1-1-3]|nr:helix-turn-helix domain-containing protein [Mesorhizobium sp. BR1-1-3]